MRLARVYRDRLRTVSLGPWWFQLCFTCVGGGLSLYVARRRLIYRPIPAAALRGKA
jgi:hypothetical protein